MGKTYAELICGAYTGAVPWNPAQQGQWNTLHNNAGYVVTRKKQPMF